MRRDGRSSPSDGEPEVVWQSSQMVDMKAILRKAGTIVLFHLTLLLLLTLVLQSKRILGRKHVTNRMQWNCTQTYPSVRYQKAHPPALENHPTYPPPSRRALTLQTAVIGKVIVERSPAARQQVPSGKRIIQSSMLLGELLNLSLLPGLPQPHSPLVPSSWSL